MLGHRELTLEDYFAILRRRVWLIVISALLLLGVGIGLTFVIPPEYESQTLVIVQQQRVPEDYVKPVINEDLNARLASMREQILSRSRLEPIIERFSLFSGANRTMDDRVDMTRKAIQVKPILSGVSKMPGFYITFKGQNARTAQQVCAEITALFVSESLSAREQSAEGTTAFLSQQLAEAKRNLDDQDSKLATLQKKYMGRLPGQQQSNLNTLQALTTQLDAATQSLTRLQQDETVIAAMVAQQGNELQNTNPDTGVSTETLQTRLKTLNEQKKELESHYTPDYPDVVAISRRIADVEDEIARASAPAPQTAAPQAATTRPDPPQLQQAKAQLHAIRLAIAAKKQEQDRIAQRVRQYESRVESSPGVEEEFKQVTRDHETALQFYNNLLVKMNESSMATDLERRQQGEQFQVLDAANLPDGPSFPNPVVFAAGGFAVGLMLGILITALLEYRDKSLRTERDIFAFTKLPTLAVISYIPSLAQEDAKLKKRRFFSRAPKTLESVNG